MRFKGKHRRREVKPLPGKGEKGSMAKKKAHPVETSRFQKKPRGVNIGLQIRKVPAGERKQNLVRLRRRGERRKERSIFNGFQRGGDVDQRSAVTERRVSSGGGGESRCV